MLIHTFGAYFGLAVSRMLYDKKAEDDNRNSSCYHSDLFSMIGVCLCTCTCTYVYKYNMYTCTCTCTLLCNLLHVCYMAQTELWLLSNLQQNLM